MNDAFRGAIMVGAMAAFYLALRLAFVYLRHWRRDRRRHIMPHVFFLTLALAVTTGIIIFSVVDASGENVPLSWWEGGRMIQVALVYAGLRPLWAHNRSLIARRNEPTT